VYTFTSLCFSSCTSLSLLSMSLAGPQVPCPSVVNSYQATFSRIPQLRNICNACDVVLFLHGVESLAAPIDSMGHTITTASPIWLPPPPPRHSLMALHLHDRKYMHHDIFIHRCYCSVIFFFTPWCCLTVPETYDSYLKAGMFMIIRENRRWRF
jgi:hypothetical protein